MADIFIIGSKGIPANYGGFETFVDRLCFYKKNKEVKYHVACLSSNEKEFWHNGARCFNIPVKNIGSAKAIIYDVMALLACMKYISENNLKDSTVYILACRIGPILGLYKNRLMKLGIKVYLNPDGHEWKRSKWNSFVRAYWKYSERLMVKYADLVICDSIGIKDYIENEYRKYTPTTRFIAYGADTSLSTLRDDDAEVLDWYKQFNLKQNEYYLIVGRFVPENNYETIIREFMNSSIDKDLVVVTNLEKNKFYDTLIHKTGFRNDPRVKFVGTIYNKDLLKKVRENAYGYIHGHEVGGTNPSLLEALAATKINILLDVIFNKEVGQGGAIYFSKVNGDLKRVLEQVNKFEEDDIEKLSLCARTRIIENYSWDKIVDEYENLFVPEGKL